MADGDERMDFTSLARTIEGRAPVPLPPYRDRGGNICFVTCGVIGVAGKLYDAFPIPVVQSHEDLVDSLFHSVRSLHAYKNVKVQPTTSSMLTLLSNN